MKDAFYKEQGLFSENIIQVKTDSLVRRLFLLPACKNVRKLLLIDQNVSWLCPFRRAYDTEALHGIHETAGPGIPDAESALESGDRSTLRIEPQERKNIKAVCNNLQIKE